MSSISNLDWQVFANIATSLALFITVIALLREIIVNRKEREFTLFFKYLESFEKIAEQRRSKWKKIKDTIQSNPNLQHEIGDRTSSFDYLLSRIQQPEALYSIEHGLIETEIRSLNLLNEICRLSQKDPRLAELTGALLGSEVSYYQNRLDDLLFMKEHESKERLFSIPKYQALSKFKTANYFDNRPIQSK